MPDPTAEAQETFSPFDGLAVRIGLASKKNVTVDYSLPPEQIRAGEKSLLTAINGIEPRNIVMLNQVHGNDIVRISSYPDRDTPFYADADGMITPLAGLCLVIRTADCVPVFLYDRRLSLLGAAHAGWRGCRLDITGALCAAMSADYGSRAGDLYAYILPSIGPDSYVVNTDVSAHFPEDTRRRDGRLYLDLWGVIKRSLAKSGVPGNRVFLAGRCTVLRNGEYFSHRMGDAGRNLNYGYISPSP
mgnify:CR=1 FL=1